MPCIKIEHGYICMSDPPLLKIGFFEIEWHRYFGPGFFWKNKNFIPGEKSPL
jgi:hypothetical protein